MKLAPTIFLAVSLFGASVALGEDSLASLLAPVSLPAPNAGGDSTPTAVASTAQPAKAAGHVVTEAEVTAKIEKILSTQFSLDGALQLALARPWDPIRVPSEDWSIIIPQMPIGGIARTFMIEVRVMANDRAWYDSNLVVQAQLMKPALVATRRLMRGEALDSTAAEVRTIDVLREREKPIPADTALESNQVLQTMEQGEPLNWKDIGAVPLVKRGSVVDVVANDGGISISMKGMAMQTGGEGEIITVQNMDTRKDFQARVVNKNTVRVSF